jgi:hypothetical protein
MAGGVYDHLGLGSFSTSISERCVLAVVTYLEKAAEFVLENWFGFGQDGRRRVGWKSPNSGLVNEVDVFAAIDFLKSSTDALEYQVNAMGYSNVPGLFNIADLLT